jgi:hypothetical protein
MAPFDIVLVANTASGSATTNLLYESIDPHQSIGWTLRRSRQSEATGCFDRKNQEGIMEYDLHNWPELDWPQWKDTAETLHMYMQIVGKTRLALTPLQNHWWNVALYLTARGLSTSAMPFADGHSLDIEFDFVAHELIFRTSSGEIRRNRLEAKPVKTFYAEFLSTLSDLGVEVHIDPKPAEVANPIRFDQDDFHKSYDPEAVSRFWNVLRLAEILFKKFCANFYGKISPVHFFWGSMDLAVTRFNGKRAPSRPGADAIQAEAYSHEVISAGFWPGNGGYGQAAFYAYSAPVPDGLGEKKIQGPGAFNRDMGEFLLNYSDVLRSSDPQTTVMDFLQNTYSATADAAGWDRANLDRQNGFIPRALDK